MFDCLFDKCPRDGEVCHLWWEIPWENEQTGEHAIRKGCILSQEMGLPIVQAIVKAAHVSSEHASKARNSADHMRMGLAEVVRRAEELNESGKQQEIEGCRRPTST